MKAKIIMTDGLVVAIEPKNGQCFTLHELQIIVEGFIEILRPESDVGAVMVVNEEGKLQGLAKNFVATEIWHDQAEQDSPRRKDCIYGNVLLCQSNQIG